MFKIELLSKNINLVIYNSHKYVNKKKIVIYNSHKYVNKKKKKKNHDYTYNVIKSNLDLD